VKKTAALVFFLVLIVTASVSSGDCYNYENTHVQYFESCACYACAGTGPGCTACTNGSDTCYTNASSCGPFSQEP